MLLFCNSKRPVFVVVVVVLVVVVAVLWISSTQIYQVNKLFAFTLLMPSIGVSGSVTRPEMTPCVG